MDDGGADETPDNGARSASRREFLKRAGIGAAGAAVGASAVGAAWAISESGTQPTSTTDDTYGFSPLPPRHEPGFDHVVVIMYENRSFDHIFGRLYADHELRAGQRFEGLQTGNYANTAPDGTVVPAHVYAGPTDVVMAQPDPDPGEHYPHVNTQLFGTVDPPANAEFWQNGFAPPWNEPEDTAHPTMSGFVTDYVANFRAERGVDPTVAEYSRVMGGFSREMLPVFSTLARSFAVYDHWHCAVPSQTFCNRSFFHASTSHGFVTNDEGGAAKWLNAPAVPTIFNRLEDAGKTWRVYYDARQIVSMTGFLHAPSIEKYWRTNFRGMEQFAEDCRTGRLPDYAFIEPRLIFDHNDMHPPGSLPAGARGYDAAMSDVRAAEVLLADVYAAVRGGRSTTGSNALNTALVVTFDEHGGIYDHVPPPASSSPSGRREPGEMGFTFDRLGGRVPTFVVSAYTAEGTIVNDPMHHASVIRTIVDLHGLEPLTHRDDDSRGIRNAVNLTIPRQPQLWPDVPRPYVPPNPEHTTIPPSDEVRRRPLTAPAKGLLGLLLARYEPEAPEPVSYGDAYDILDRHGRELFGVGD